MLLTDADIRSLTVLAGAAIFIVIVLIIDSMIEDYEVSKMEEEDNE